MKERRREMFAGDTHVCRALALHNAVSRFQNHLIAEASISYTHCILENKQLLLYMVWLIHDLTSLQSREKDHHTDSCFLWLCRMVPALPGVQCQRAFLRVQDWMDMANPQGNKQSTEIIVTFMVDFGWVKFFIPRISFGTHKRPQAKSHYLTTFTSW